MTTKPVYGPEPPTPAQKLDALIRFPPAYNTADAVRDAMNASELSLADIQVACRLAKLLRGQLLEQKVVRYLEKHEPGPRTPSALARSETLQNGSHLPTEREVAAFPLTISVDEQKRQIVRDVMFRVDLMKQELTLEKIMNLRKKYLADEVSDTG